MALDLMDTLLQFDVIRAHLVSTADQRCLPFFSSALFSPDLRESNQHAVTYFTGC